MEKLMPLTEALYRSKPKFKSLCHGEPRVDNIIFDTEAETTKAYLIDWQFTGFSNPMFDLAYFCSGSIEEQQRKETEDELVKEHNRIIREVAPDYTLDQAQADYALCLNFGLMTTVAAAVTVPKGEHQDRLLLTLARRNCDAIRHNSSLELALKVTGDSSNG